MKRLLLITRVLSPFQLELTQALRDAGVDAHVLFSTGGQTTRPRHWKVEPPNWTHIVDIESYPLRLRPIFRQLRPEAVIYGGYRGWPVPLAKRLCAQSGARMGFWLERPLPTTTAKKVVRDLMIQRALKGADFVWPIGPLALQTYSPLVSPASELNVVPYGQDYSQNLKQARDYPHADGPITFLFSGKYEHRNNVWELLSAFRSIRAEFGKRARLMLSGYSGMDAAIREHIRTDTLLSDAVEHDVDFSEWEERLRPFRRSDVFYLPGVHAGWGLVVPEAMSLGMPVIAGHGIESAQMLVRPGQDGFLVGPSYLQVQDAMRRFLENPSLVAEIGQSARKRVEVCDVASVARRMLELLRLQPSTS